MEHVAPGVGPVYADGVNHHSRSLPLVLIADFPTYCGPVFFVNLVRQVDEHGTEHMVNTMERFVPVPLKTAKWENSAGKECTHESSRHSAQSDVGQTNGQPFITAI